MAVVEATIFQIVGYQNSGKTTLIKRVIEQFQKNNLSVVTLKHHGHGGKPDFQDERDSHKHLKAGAIASLVEGDGHLLLQAEKIVWSLEEKLQLLSFFQPDIILIEGHKRESYPKAVLIRTKDDLDLLMMLENIQVIFFWEKELMNEMKEYQEIRKFAINDSDGYKWLVNHLSFIE
ncbi:molybdopterin-guanine dinucleotide biosynthesis protein B [Robertmurraya massiliosenegalensis]|uniref:molybdopterin-guanine dinucleotide biosynthesis protein B n=1 Tax=Robertmurraya TaxID=2837507 RepID=UPI0039A72E70